MEHPYYDYLTDYDTGEVMRMYGDEKPWTNRINPESYQQALSEFVKYGELIRFPKNKIYQWFGIIMRNTAILRSLTEIAGHDTYFPIYEFIDTFFDDDNDRFQEYKEEIGEDSDYSAAMEYLDNLDPPFFEWFMFPDGSDPWSDYGIKPLEEIISEYNDNKTAEETLVLLNKALDIGHQRGDLASIFIVGGSKSLTMISDKEPVKDKLAFVLERLDQIMNMSK